MVGFQKQMLKAREIQNSFGNLLREDPETGLLLREYRRAIHETTRTMEQEGVARACAICDETNRGGCCYPGVEEWYDSTLLAVNLLLGGDLPVTPETPGACFFAGPLGCRLIARHAFCINYFCPDLERRLRGLPRSRLDYTAGQELLCGWRLEQTIRLRLRIMQPSRPLP